jgi:hypothetical protein
MMNNSIQATDNQAKPAVLHGQHDLNQVQQPTQGELTKRNRSDKQRVVGMVELLFTAATIGAAVVTAALMSPKRPESASD